MSKIKVKICGITRVEDALCACQNGAWAIGYIFVKESKRFIEPKNAGDISKNLPDNIEKIGVFVNSSIEEIEQTTKIAKLSKIQLHGDETPEFCNTVKERTGLDIIKALRIRSEKDLEKIIDYKNIVNIILLDTYSEKEYGGTGETFDWELAQTAKKYNLPVIIAGGLNPQNINCAYNEVEPFALDVSSGVEIEKGIKNKDKIKELFDNLNE